MDYSRRNFWPDQKDEEDHGYDDFEPTGFIESENHDDGEHETYGYGNENSQFVEDFNRMKRGRLRQRNYRDREERTDRKNFDHVEEHEESYNPFHDEVFDTYDEPDHHDEF
ncbi:MAG: hypothetical protein ACJ76F_12930, partial [Bacteroidia bacterium]